MSSWEAYEGYGQPAWQLLTDAVVSSIRAGNASGSVDLRLGLGQWETALVHLSASRPVEIETAENRASVITHICGRKVRIFAVESLSPDRVEFKAAP
jgi:hypothetical protein